MNLRELLPTLQAESAIQADTHEHYAGEFGAARAALKQAGFTKDSTPKDKDHRGVSYYSRDAGDTTHAVGMQRDGDSVQWSHQTKPKGAADAQYGDSTRGRGAKALKSHLKSLKLK